MNVDLPAPLGPITPCTTPGSSSMETSVSAASAPYRTVSPCAAKMLIGLSPFRSRLVTRCAEPVRPPGMKTSTRINASPVNRWRLPPKFRCAWAHTNNPVPTRGPARLAGPPMSTAISESPARVKPRMSGEMYPAFTANKAPPSEATTPESTKATRRGRKVL